jgi:hypothetical protein
MYTPGLLSSEFYQTPIETLMNYISNYLKMDLINLIDLEEYE